MKYARVQFSLVALLLAALAPGAMASPKAAPAVIRKAPQLVADYLPVPWPKRPGSPTSGTKTTSPQLVADYLPVPWPKRPGSPTSGTKITSPQLVADYLPVPWPKRPGSPQN